MRTTERITVTVPKALAARAREEVAKGLAPSLSAWIADAMWAKSGGPDLSDVLDEILEETGGPMTPEEEAWADQILSRSFWTQER